MATDAEIRAAGLYAVPNRQYLQNEFQLPDNTPTETEEVTESFGIPYTNAFTGGGGGGGQGGGKFGNLNMDTAKQFNINGKTVTGYKNQGSGLYQDIDGLNIQNLGINSFGMAGILEKAFGLKNEDDDPKYPGYFTKNKINNLTLGSFKNFFDRQDKTKQDALQKEIEAANKAAAQSAQLSREGREKYTGPGQAFEARTDTFTGGKTVDSPSTPGGKYGSPKKDGGRIGYFFGGRVNYKVGGRTDAGANRSTASKAGVGQINEAGNKVDGGNYNDGGNNNPSFYATKPTLFDNPEILNTKTIFGDMLTGIGFDNSYGRYKAKLDLEKSLKEKALEGELEYNNNINNFDLVSKYNTQDGPTYGVGYEKNGVGVEYDNINGPSFSYNNNIKGFDVNAITDFDNLNNISLAKSLGDPNEPGFSYGIGTNIDPLNISNSNIFAEAKLKFGQGKKDGGRIGFKNGGLASIL